MWVADGLQIPSWVAQAARGEKLRVLWTDQPLASATYPAVLSCAVLLVTVTWTALVDWSSDNLQPLALLLLGEIVGVLLLAGAVLHWRRLRGRGRGEAS